MGRHTITYTAPAKLEEKTSSVASGIHINAFGVSITSHTFADGTGIVTFSGDVTSIGRDAFSECRSLTSITIPDGVTSIGLGAFYSCSAMTSLTIPSSVTNLGMMILVGCSGLTSITAEGVNPPVCESACFSDVDMSIPLYVPASSVAAYQAAEGWQDFTNILPIGSIATEVSVATAAPESNLRKDLFQGKVYITRDGHTYTILGTRVK